MTLHFGERGSPTATTVTHWHRKFEFQAALSHALGTLRLFRTGSILEVAWKPESLSLDTWALGGLATRLRNRLKKTPIADNRCGLPDHIFRNPNMPNAPRLLPLMCQPAQIKKQWRKGDEHLAVQRDQTVVDGRVGRCVAVQQCRGHGSVTGDK
jgi:hypothetical protein